MPMAKTTRFTSILANPHWLGYENVRSSVNREIKPSLFEREKEREKEREVSSMICEESNGRNEWKIGNLWDQRGRGLRSLWIRRAIIRTRDQWNHALNTAEDYPLNPLRLSYCRSPSSTWLELLQVFLGLGNWNSFRSYSVREFTSWGKVRVVKRNVMVSYLYET